MGLFNRKKPVKQVEETRSTDFSGDTLLKSLLGTDETTYEMAMNIPAFASCVEVIAGTISTLPFKLYKRSNDSVEEVKDDARVRLLNKDTGDTLTGAEFKKAIVRDYLTNKGAYVYINKVGNEVKSLHYVESQHVTFVFNNDPIFKNYKINVNAKEYDRWQFLKILRCTKNGYSGESIIQQNSKQIAVSYNSLNYENNLVKTGGNKRGFLQATKRLSEEAITALKTAFRNLYSGTDENVVVLNDGLTFQEASSSSVEMQLNEQKRTNSSEICKIFNIPQNIINGSASEQDKVNFAQFCLLPILEEIMESLNRDLLLESEKNDYFFSADMTELTKGDIDKRYNAYATALKNGFMQPDEVRERENLPSLNMKWLMFGLQNIFYDPSTGNIYTPNTNKVGNMNGEIISDPNAPQQIPAIKQDETVNVNENDVDNTGKEKEG